MGKKKKIFLTGINGFLGSHVALKLSRQGHHVIGLIRGDTLPGILKNCSIEYHKGDLLDPESYNTILKKCNVVIHTAAITSFGLNRPKDYYRVNYEGTKLLLESSKRNGIERFIHTSTRGTLGVAHNPKDSDETCENRDINRADDYIKSKYMAEREIIRHSKEGNMPCVILSPTALIGAYDYKPTPVGRIILSFLRGKIQVYMNGGVNVIDVEDAAEVFVSTLNKGRNGQIYILGNKNITLYELFQQLSTISNVPAPKIRIPFALAFTASFLIERLSKLRGVPPLATPKKVVSLYNNYSYCSPNKAMRTFGLSQTPIILTLEKVVNWYKENEKQYSRSC